MREMLLAVYSERFPYSCIKQEGDMFMVIGVFDFYPTFRFIIPNKEKKDKYAPWIIPPTLEEDVKITVAAPRREGKKHGN